MDKDIESAKDVPVSDPSIASTSSTPTTSAATDVSDRRSCPLGVKSAKLGPKSLC